MQIALLLISVSLIARIALQTGMTILFGFNEQLTTAAGTSPATGVIGGVVAVMTFVALAFVSSSPIMAMIIYLEGAFLAFITTGLSLGAFTEYGFVLLVLAGLSFWRWEGKTKRQNVLSTGDWA